MSIRTTSGLSARAAVDRLAPVRRLADDLDVGLGVEDHPEAGADERLVVGDQDPDHSCGASSGSCARNDEAAAVARPGLERAAAQRDALAHPDEPVPVGPSPFAPTAVVGDLELEPSSS